MEAATDEEAEDNRKERMKGDWQRGEDWEKSDLFVGDHIV
jgi:hypothetical protein